MFGRLPWFALLRRILAFFLLVFFDIGPKAYRNGKVSDTFPLRGGPGK